MSAPNGDATNNNNVPKTPMFSGKFTPEVVESQQGQNEFQVPLDNPESSKQVVGETDGSINRLFMPGRVRQYIPTLYKQAWLNTRAILSVNGYEVLDGDANDGQTAVTSDIRNSVLRNGSAPFLATTATLKDTELGMTKLVISESNMADGSARTLSAKDAMFMVHDGELYDTYTFVEAGGHIEYVQAKNAAGQVIYVVLQYEGFFSNASQATGQNVSKVTVTAPQPVDGDDANPQ